MTDHQTSPVGEDAERAAFEAWARPQPYWWNGQTYSDLHTQIAWDAWQAARRSAPAAGTVEKDAESNVVFRNDGQEPDWEAHGQAEQEAIDAARYRWLRKPYTTQDRHLDVCDDSYKLITGDELDRQVDAEIEAHNRAGKEQG